MAGIIVFTMLLTLLFGGGMLALVLGYLETEKTRARELAATMGAPAPAPEAVREHRFFAALEEGAARVQPTAPSDELIHELETFLKTEQALAARFVNEPSIDNLYRHASASSSVH